jgi:glycosyltransferase involved in cell wall biosynthesis
LKVIHLITSINRGGAENHVHDLALYQKNQGYKVEIVHFKGDGYWRKNFKKNGIKVLCFNPYFKITKFINYLIFFYRLVKYIKLSKVDVLHSHLPLMDIFVRFIFYFLNKSFIFISTKHLDNYSLRGSDRYKNTKSYLSILIENWIISKCDKFIAISKNVKNFYFKNFSLPRNYIKIVYYGISKIQDNQTKKKIIFFPKNKTKIIFGTISRLVKQKRIDVTFRALSILKKENINFLYYIIGEGPLLIYLKNLAKSLKIEENVKFIGYSDDINRFFKHIDVFCLSSDHEGLGLVLLESMISGVPIVCSKFGAACEIIPNDNFGLLFNKSDYEDMAHKLKTILSSNLRKKISKNSKKYVTNYFSMKKCFNKTHSIYISELKKLYRC